ncbi:DUF983 domain-containing protein [Flavobacterium selenitireducens]|uniref:DUF983 domain-containing protein n=1 Tax=Flavobacterium selenitireducens TaxID=2722704 RepID=UPI00168AFF3A|nr:DUF983 domain-containing protein [Flavobacterium selenitireducens]MBD3583331.1 DUF983 domain-containing protein [Flavobacterium selenitireducens]
MLKKGSKLYSILTGTCPKCNSDKMFVNPNPYNIGQNLKMHTRCRKCGFVYKMETSFFFGAMYVSYGLAVFLGMVIFGIAYALGAGLLTAFGWIFFLLFALMPVITRVSRAIYINLFVNYDANAVKRYEENA